MLLARRLPGRSLVAQQIMPSISVKVLKPSSSGDSFLAQFDLGMYMGLLVNIIPAVFWTLWHVFSDSLLLAEMRHGIESKAFAHPNGLAGGSILTVNIARVT